MSSSGSESKSDNPLLETDSPYLTGEHFSRETGDASRRRAARLAAESPFTQELGQYESWMTSLPAGVTRHVFPVPEKVGKPAQPACSVFLAANASKDYEQYIAAPTTGRMTLFINGRYWGGKKPRADQFDTFNEMQKAVEGLKPGNSLFLAAWMFDPSVPLTRTSPLGVKTWGELFKKKAGEGVTIRIIMTDFSSLFADQFAKLYKSFLPAMAKLVDGLSSGARDNLKYIVSLHPAMHKLVHVATHHQKFMVVKTAEATTAFCGGLDIAFMRTPAYWGDLSDNTYRWLWHDIHSRLEGLVVKDLEQEFVLRWNREKDHSVVPSLPGWKPFEQLNLAAATTTDKTAGRNTQQLQMLRTVSVDGTRGKIQQTQRDDIWQGYLRLIGCATQFLYMENQYFREPRMADAIVKQAKAQKELIVIIVVPSETDDKPDPGKKHGDALQHEFFQRLHDNVPESRWRVYSMFHRIIHSKFIMADDRVLSIGSANANPRGFFMDSELNVMLDDPEGVAAFRHNLWAHNLGISETTVAAWSPSAFIARWNEVAAANEGVRKHPEKMTGEAIIPFDPLKEKGERQPFVEDVETEVRLTRSEAEVLPFSAPELYETPELEVFEEETAEPEWEYDTPRDSQPADSFVLDDDGRAYFTMFPQLGDLTIQKVTVLKPAVFEHLVDLVLASKQKNFVIDAHGDPNGLHMLLAVGTKLGANKQAFFMLRGIERIRFMMQTAKDGNTIWDRASGTDLDKWQRILKSIHTETWQKMVGKEWPTETPQASDVDAAKRILESRINALVDALFPGSVSDKYGRVDRLIKKMLQLQGKGIREIQFRACNIGKDSGSLFEFRKFFGADHLCAPDVRSGIGLVVPRIGKADVDSLAKRRLTQSYDLPSGRFAIFIEIVGTKFTAACAADTQAALEEWVASHLMADSKYRKGTLPIHFLQTRPLRFALEKEYAAHIQCSSSLWEGAVRAHELEEAEAHQGEEQTLIHYEEENVEFDSREPN